MLSATIAKKRRNAYTERVRRVRKDVRRRTLKKPNRNVPEPKAAQSYYYRQLSKLSRVIRNATQKVLTKKRIAQIHAELSGRKDSAHLDADALTLAINEIRTLVEREFPFDSEELATEVERMIARHVDKVQRSIIQQVASIDLRKVRPLENRASRAFVGENVQLIESIPEDEYSRMHRTIRKAILEGQRVETLQKTIVEKFFIGKSKGQVKNVQARAALISRDQVLKHNGDMTRLYQKEVGVTKYIWRTSGDQRVRSSHANLNGKTFTWEEGATQIGGLHPGQDFQCRCHAEPVFEDIDTLEDLE